MSKQFKSVEQINASGVLTPFEKQIEAIILNNKFSNREADMFRLIGKFYDKTKSMQHWIKDGYLNCLIEDTFHYIQNFER